MIDMFVKNLNFMKTIDMFPAAWLSSGGINRGLVGLFNLCMGDVGMKLFCILSAVGLIIAFLMANLFLPFALLILAAAICLGIYCGVIRSPGKKECRLGPC